MCASVEDVLKDEFGKGLATEVVILDPCTGTGNFIVNLMRRMPAATCATPTENSSSPTR